MDFIKKWLGSILRKALFAVGSVWIAKLIEAGVLTNADIDRVIEVIVAALLIIIPALWTDFIKPILAKMLAKLK